MSEDNSQTNFSAEEPLFESTTLHINSDTPQAVKVPLHQNKKVLIGVGFGLLFFVILILVLLQPRSAIRQVVEPSFIPIPDAAVGPQQAKINELMTELKAADPATQELPFPAVDLTLDIPDDKQLR